VIRVRVIGSPCLRSPPGPADRRYDPRARVGLRGPHRPAALLPKRRAPSTEDASIASIARSSAVLDPQQTPRRTQTANCGPQSSQRPDSPNARGNHQARRGVWRRTVESEKQITMRQLGCIDGQLDPVVAAHERRRGAVPRLQAATAIAAWSASTISGRVLCQLRKEADLHRSGVFSVVELAIFAVVVGVSPP
jgi:hypothetical protein